MKKLSPRNAKTMQQIVSLKTSGHDLKSAWIEVDDRTVTILGRAPKLLGTSKTAASTARIVLSRREFNLLIDWYLKDQPIVKR